MTVNTERTHTLTSSQFLGCGKNVQESIIACGFGGDLTAPPTFGRRGSCRLDWVPLPQNIQISVICSIILIHSSTQANSGHIQNILLIVTMAITDTKIEHLGLIGPCLIMKIIHNYPVCQTTTIHQFFNESHWKCINTIGPKCPRSKRRGA